MPLNYGGIGEVGKNRTFVASLKGKRSTIELQPRGAYERTRTSTPMKAPGS